MNNIQQWKKLAAGLLLPAVLAVGLAACGKSDANGSAATVTATPAAAEAHVVEVDAANFSWTVSQTDFKAGEPIRFHVVGKDGAHGFSIVGTDINFTITKGKTQDVTWTPDKPGEYTIKCAEMCGSGHSSMRTTFTVT